MEVKIKIKLSTGKELELTQEEYNELPVVSTPVYVSSPWKHQYGGTGCSPVPGPGYWEYPITSCSTTQDTQLEAL